MEFEKESDKKLIVLNSSDTSKEEPKNSLESSRILDKSIPATEFKVLETQTKEKKTKEEPKTESEVESKPGSKVESKIESKVASKTELKEKETEREKFAITELKEVESKSEHQKD